MRRRRKFGAIYKGNRAEGAKFFLFEGAKWRFVRGERSEKGPNSPILPPSDLPPCFGPDLIGGELISCICPDADILLILLMAAILPINSTGSIQ